MQGDLEDILEENLQVEHHVLEEQQLTLPGESLDTNGATGIYPVIVEEPIRVQQYTFDELQYTLSGDLQQSYGMSTHTQNCWACPIQ